jgi:glutamine synthetase
MSGVTPRKNAISEITNRAPKVCEMPGHLSKIWATDVFGVAAIEEAQSKNAF